MKRAPKLLCAVGLVALSLAGRATADEAPATDAAPLGKRVYEENCALCHGVAGDGNGEAASRFKVKPRNFVKGIYKFRSTDPGQPPTDDDLRRSIVCGLGGTAMIPQNHLSTTEVDAVIQTIKAFSPDVMNAPPPRPVKLPERHDVKDAPIDHGIEMYDQAGCGHCHGEKALGDGLAADSLSVPPTDFTKRPLKGGDTPQDIVRAIVTGLDGTPMPSYHLVLDDRGYWAIARYLVSLGGKPRMTEDARLAWELTGRTPPPDFPSSTPCAPRVDP